MTKSKISGVGVIICLERENGNLWTNDTRGREWLLELGDRVVRRGLPGRSCNFASRVQPAMEHRGGIWGNKCLRAKSSLSSTSGQFSLCLSPPGSQRQESFFCDFIGQFPGTESRLKNVTEWNWRGKWRTVCFLLKGIISWFIIGILTSQKMYHKHFLKKTSDSSFLNNLEGIPGWRFTKLKWGKN